MLLLELGVCIALNLLHGHIKDKKGIEVKEDELIAFVFEMTIIILLIIICFMELDDINQAEKLVAKLHKQNQQIEINIAKAKNQQNQDEQLSKENQDNQLSQANQNNQIDKKYNENQANSANQTIQNSDTKAIQNFDSKTNQSYEKQVKLYNKNETKIKNLKRFIKRKRPKETKFLLYFG